LAGSRTCSPPSRYAATSRPKPATSSTSIPNRWLALSEWVTGSTVIGAWAHPVVQATRRLMSPSTTPLSWPMSRCCRTRSSQARWGLCCGLWIGSMARASAARGCITITGAPIAPNSGEKLAQHLGTHQNAPGRTHHEPTPKPCSSSRPCWRSGRIRCLSRRQMIGVAGCRAIWRCKTAAGVIWPWLAAHLFSSSECCELLNELVRKHK